MAATASTTRRTFPDQQAIINYFNSHPMKITGCFDKPVMQNYSIEKVAAFFANKIMTLTEIEKNVRSALFESIPDEEVKKLAQLTIALQVFADKPTGSASNVAHELSAIHDRTKPANPTFEVPVMIYAEVLKDLIEKAPCSPPKDGGTTLTKHVADLTKEKS